MEEIYFDNSATTKTLPEVNEKMLYILENVYANPSSLHSLGMKAEKEFRQAKNILADTLSCREDEIYITSGGTESDNMAILGYIQAVKRKAGHILVSGAEHPGVYEAAKHAADEGFEVEEIGVDKNGVIVLSDIENKLRKDTALVCVMHVNNEVGSVMPIEKIKPIMKKKSPYAALFVDAVQSYGKIALRPEKMGIDMLSASSHKIHGPKGVGLLYIKKGVRTLPIIYGGHQQKNLRSGTENVYAAAGFALAAKIANENLSKNYDKVLSIKNRLLSSILKNIDNVCVNSDENTIPYILNVSFLGVRSEILLHALESRGIYVSSGSACSSNAPAPSRTLLSMKKSREQIDSAIRFSFSCMNNEEQIDIAAKALKEEVENIRKHM